MSSGRQKAIYWARWIHGIGLVYIKMRTSNGANVSVCNATLLYTCMNIEYTWFSSMVCLATCSVRVRRDVGSVWRMHTNIRQLSMCTRCVAPTARGTKQLKLNGKKSAAYRCACYSIKCYCCSHTGSYTKAIDEFVHFSHTNARIRLVRCACMHVSVEALRVFACSDRVFFDGFSHRRAKLFRVCVCKCETR